MDPSMSPPGGSAAPPPGLMILPVAHDDIPRHVFYVLNWVFFAICTLAFAIRIYIRIACFRRLLLEDYIMIVALILHNAEAVLIQLFVGYAYDLEQLQEGKPVALSPNFFSQVEKSFVSVGTSISLTIVGVLLVKLNFLLFFRCLGSHIRWFAFLWWATLVLTVGTAAAQIGMQDFQCFFGGIELILGGRCATIAVMDRIFFNAIFSAVVDALTDLLIICFPVAILWRSRIDMRKKIALTFIFCLVSLTMAITIIRGSIFHDVYDPSSDRGRMQSVTFTWFWFYCEFTVAFIIACLVSFRTLFLHRERKYNARKDDEERRKALYESARRRGIKGRLRYFHDSVLDTCKTLEGRYSDESDTLTMRDLPGLMTVDFNDDANWTKNLPKTATTETTSLSGTRDGSGSVQSLLGKPEATYMPGRAV
ncbi:hypothetical protein S7711_06543 [Stachybotrys chartarum IBT 7711]|uniref:Rhodopsin domain-containing protein n=1 Tax=Stachybotrys chartarum (strain CBS 109288 / IBT 7711) TaxID=1280523 RepID=A0A084B2L2_STACB|nr:hypothetical protein S7711_06543 [Stachybotrys chartarum IBT 7711]